MINILELESSKGWGGQEKRTARLVNSLDKSQFKVFWAVQPNSELLKRQHEIDATFFEVAIKKSYDLVALWKIIKLIKEHRIDIIATHSGKDGWIGALAGLFTNAKVIRTRHLQTPITSPLSYNLNDHVVTVSRQVKEYLISRGVKEDKLSVIYTGVDTQRFSPTQKHDIKEELGLDKETIIVGIVAVLRAAKRHKDLIEAFSNIQTDKKIALVIVGSGPQYDTLQELIKTSPRANDIFMLGHREDIDRMLPSFDIIVLPSNMEALGTAILEASACAVTCVGSRVGGIPECIHDLSTGFLFEKENVQELSHALTKLINDDALRQTYSHNARQLVETSFSVTTMTEKTEDLYKKMCS